MKGLEDDADVLAAKSRKLVFAQTRKRLPGNLDNPLVGALQTRKHHQQRRLAGTGRPDDADGLAALDVQVHALENMHGAVAGAEGQMNVSQPDRWFCQGCRLLYAKA